MFCNRCVMVVRNELERMGLEPVQVALGEAEIKNDLKSEQKETLRDSLSQLGFELLDDKKCQAG